MKPINKLTPEQIDEMRLPFRLSSRAKALNNAKSNFIGASCNYFAIEDNISSIGDSFKWATDVLYSEGAPSLDLSNLRPAGSYVSGGGTASGAVSFGRIHDSIIGQMRRVEKKNGAGIVGIDYRHPELSKFLDEPFSYTYKMVYVPMHDTPEAELLLQDPHMVELLTKAYNDFKTFLVKRPLPLIDGTELGLNMCTEVVLPHKGFCILGAINLSYFTPQNIHFLPHFFKLGMRTMVEYQELAQDASAKSSSLACDSEANKQVGLGIYGLASVLGAWGISYEEFNSSLKYYGVDRPNRTINAIKEAVDSDYTNKGLSELFVSTLVKAYYEASVIAHHAGLRAAFCIQPTATLSKLSLDAHGYHVSPEIQPVVGLKHDEGVSYIRKSAVKGDTVQVCHPGTWTLDEVPYEDYALTSSLLQQLMDSTGLAHRHSHCFYGERYTTADFRNFYTGERHYIQSMYYRLPYNNNTESLRKDKLWQEVEEGELFEGDLSELFAGCSLQIKGELDCDCQM